MPVTPPVLVVGSVAFDTIEAPAGRRERILGGAANYFSLAASQFCPVQLVAVVGDDFPEAHVRLLASRGVDVSGLQRVPGKSFHWAGRYSSSFNDRTTLATELNVFADFKPVLPPAYRDTALVFLANIHPQLQLDVLDQVKAPEFVVADTMNFWITGALEPLRQVLRRVHGVVLNESEAQELSGYHNLMEAARCVQSMGPKLVVIKLGAYGALLFYGDARLYVPAYPLGTVIDPTGAGDTFGGGFMGYLARAGQRDLATFHRAAAVGSVMGAFVCEDFGVQRLIDLTPGELHARFMELHKMAAFSNDPIL